VQDRLRRGRDQQEARERQDRGRDQQEAHEPPGPRARPARSSRASGPLSCGCCLRRQAPRPVCRRRPCCAGPALARSRPAGSTRA
jgi:hypothetical protein